MPGRVYSAKIPFHNAGSVQWIRKQHLHGTDEAQRDYSQHTVDIVSTVFRSSLGRLARCTYRTFAIGCTKGYK